MGMFDRFRQPESPLSVSSGFVLHGRNVGMVCHLAAANHRYTGQEF